MSTVHEGKKRQALILGFYPLRYEPRHGERLKVEMDINSSC